MLSLPLAQTGKLYTNDLRLLAGVTRGPVRGQGKRLSGKREGSFLPFSSPADRVSDPQAVVLQPPVILQDLYHLMTDHW